MDGEDMLNYCDLDEPSKIRWWQVLLFFWVLS